MVTAAFYLSAILSQNVLACARQDFENLPTCAEAVARAGTEIYLSDEEPAWLKARADFGRDPEGVYETLFDGAVEEIMRAREELNR